MMSNFNLQRLPLAKRLYLVLILAAAVVFTTFFISSWWTQSRSLETMLQQNGQSISMGLEQSIGLGMQLEEINFVHDGAASVANISNILSVDIYNRHGERLILLGAKHDVIVMNQLSKAKLDGLFYQTLDGSRLERVIAPVHANHGELVGYSVLDLSRAAVNKSIRSVLIISALISLLLLLTFWWMTGLAIRQLQRPLNELDNAVEAVAHGQLDISVNTAIPDPLGRIARGFNRMTRSLADEQQSLRLQSEELEKSERRFRELFTHMPLAMYMTDMDGRLRQCNPAMASLFGYESSSDMLADVRCISELYVHPQERDALIAELVSVQSVVSREVRFSSKRIEDLQCLLHARLVTDEDGQPKGIEGVIQDMTELRLLESNLLQAHKMEVVGQLAGGVAHDFNNLMSVVLGNAELLASHISNDDSNYHYVKRIKQAGKRAAELTANLLGFARKGDMRHEPVVVATLLQEVIDLVKETSDRRVEIILQVSQDNLKVIGDPGQLHQVFMNLAINAMHAMPDGGELVFKVTPKRGMVLIQVKDSGMGMTQQTIEHIFEPFYTTRETGKGTGLGLSMVYGIIEKMGGTISVESEPGQGTTFHIELPLQHLEAEPATAEPSAEMKNITLNGHVLLVDDEPLLREVGEEILKSFGFRVSTAASGEEALALLSASTFQADILLLDLNMPGMGGVETLREIRRNDEPVKVIVLSGYNEATLDSDNHELNYDGFIMKPYQFSELCAEVSRVLSI